jgi:hypothetical protein
VVGREVLPGVWEVVVLVRLDLQHRAAALRVEAAARDPAGHAGPPGRRLAPLRRLEPGMPVEGWIVTGLALLF